VNEGKIEGVFPSQNHPLSKGRLCVRGWNIHELLRTNERITEPLVKKNGSFESVTYDQAISNVLEKLSGYSGNEIAFLASPRSSNEENYLLMKLARSVFKTNNISINSEAGHRNSLNVLSKGAGMAGMLGSIEDIAKTEVIFVFNMEMVKQNPIIASEIHKAKKAGAKLITLDSRRTQIAKLSDVFLSCKPGSSKLATGAIAKAMVEQKLADTDFIKNNTHGFEGFANSLGSINNDEIFDRTGIKYETIAEVARLLSGADSAMAFFPSGISGLDEDSISCIYNLFLMAGKVGRDNCGVNPLTGINNLQGAYDMGLAPDLLTGFQAIEDRSVLDEYHRVWGGEINSKPGKPVYDILTENNSSLKALVVVDHDESIIKYEKELQELDLIVYIGDYSNDFISYADVVLPVASYVETDGTFTNTERRIQLNSKKIDPLKGVLPGWELYKKMAAMSSAEWNYDSAEDVMKEIALLTPSYSGVEYSKLKGTFGIKWPCDEKNPRGIDSFSLDQVQDKLKFVNVTGAFETPGYNEDYPYNLLIGKAQYFWHQNNLIKKTSIPMREYKTTLLLYPKGYAEISPEDAKTLEVRNKWPVKIVSSAGEMNVDVMVSDDVKPGTVNVPYYIKDMISKFLLEHKESIEQGEDATIPVRIERV